MGATFWSDIDQSKIKENEFGSKLRSKGYKVTVVGYMETTPYDVAAINPKTNRTTTFEVKYDKMASKTGNIAVEYCKIRDEEESTPTGISTTQADYWVFSFPGDPTFYTVPTTTLKSLISERKYMRTVSGGDNYWSRMYLFPKQTITSNATQVK
ncbi:hypothetical protein [Flaviaesturariibacter amylovorans]|uniref:PD(D/E)XK endonuclease domain-containing protein n=1 Tax=Flaviaesturariibacter amylovorans TaxID=1084520 RepID=A0ABP8GL51_9BACT